MSAIAVSADDRFVFAGGAQFDIKGEQKKRKEEEEEEEEFFKYKLSIFGKKSYGNIFFPP